MKTKFLRLQQSMQPRRIPSKKRRFTPAAILALLIVLGNVVTTLAATATLLRAPYVQQVYTDSLIVAWTTVESGTSEVRFGTADYSQTAAAISSLFTTSESAPYDSYYVHEATLTGLSPDTVYQYKIFTNSLDITPGGSINVRTAKPANSTSFRFAAFGDSGQGNQAQLDVAERLLQIEPDVVVHTGDVVYDKSTYTNYEERHFQVYADLIKSVWLAPSPGNHDTDYNGGQSYVDVFMNPTNGAADPIEREMYYSFDYANAHFTVITPEVAFGSSSDQYQWLVNDLANTHQFWKFVVFHVPPYYTDETQAFRKNGTVASTLVPLFQQNNVDVVFSGDVHFYERFQPLKDEQLATIAQGGIVYVVTGGGGAGLRESGVPPWNALSGGKAKLFHLTMLDVNGCQAQLSAVVKTEAGDPFDSSDIFDAYTLDRCDGAAAAAFEADVTSGQAALTVNFTDLSSHGPTSWLWNFGDGSSATDRHPSHTYTLAGTYTVSLTVSNSMGGDTLTKTNYVTVSDPPLSTAYFATTAYEVNESGGPVATVEVELSWPYSTPVTVNYATSDGTAVAPTDYTPSSGALTFDPGQTVKTFTVPILDDAIAEDSEQILLTLSGAAVSEPSSATITILDDDPDPEISFTSGLEMVDESIGNAELTVTLSEVSGRAVTVSYASTDDTAVGGADYTAVFDILTFLPGETSHTITVPILNDTADELQESFVVTLDKPANGTIGSQGATTVIIKDDDPPPAITFDQANYARAESSGTAVIEVLLSAASSNVVTVNYATADGSAIDGADYVATSDTFTFAPGETRKTFTVQILDDDEQEVHEIFSLLLSAAQNGNLDDPSAATVTIIDDDSSFIFLPLIQSMP